MNMRKFSGLSLCVRGTKCKLILREQKTAKKKKGFSLTPEKKKLLKVFHSVSALYKFKSGKTCKA